MFPPRRLPPLVALIAGAVWVAAAPGPAQAALTYITSSPLMKVHCTGDRDGDCLDDNIESQLALAAAPHYYYDDREDCSPEQDAVASGRKDFVQVRPVNPRWSPAGVKQVRVTYYFLHVRDCSGDAPGGERGHQGDAERVELLFQTRDLRTFELISARFHNRPGFYQDYPGPYLEMRAREIGTRYPSVAAAAGSHTSWPGRGADSPGCAPAPAEAAAGPGPAGRCFAAADGVAGDMRDAFRGGQWHFPDVARNIGEPPNPRDAGRFNPNVLTVEGRDAFSTFDVGQGPTREYWTARPGLDLFCGWQCGERRPDGHCAIELHQQVSCEPALHRKLDGGDLPQWARGSVPVRVARLGGRGTG